MYSIFVDSDCDMTPELCQKYGFKLISMPYSINGKEIFPYVDFDKFDDHAFYEELRKGTLPTTSALSPEQYKQYFEPEFKKGNDILYIHFSKAMSGTFNALNLALKELKDKYPDREFKTIDTKGITLGSYNICCTIGDMLLKGASVEDVLKKADEIVFHTAFYFYADDLKFFKRSGRVSGFAALMGGIIGIRPIIFIGDDGVMTTKAKSRGYKKTLEMLLNYVIELEDHIKDHRVVIAHSDALPIAQEFGAMMKKQFGEDLAIEYIPVNPTAGSHCGPNAIGVSFHAKHR